MIRNTQDGLTSSQKVNPRFFYGYIIALAAFSIYAIVYGSMITFGLFFKPLSADFSWTRAMTSGALSLSMFLHGLLGIIMGRLTDRYGPKMAIVVFGSFCGLSYLLMSQISTIWQFYLAFGVVMGIGRSPIVVATFSTVARWFVKRRGLMTGIVAAGAGIGQTIFAPIAGSSS